MKTPEYRTGKLEEQHLRSAEELALHRYIDLLEAPGMTEEKLEGSCSK